MSAPEPDLLAKAAASFGGLPAWAAGIATAVILLAERLSRSLRNRAADRSAIAASNLEAAQSEAQRAIVAALHEEIEQLNKRFTARMAEAQKEIDELRAELAKRSAALRELQRRFNEVTGKKYFLEGEL